jgi:hypothetical protein
MPSAVSDESFISRTAPIWLADFNYFIANIVFAQLSLMLKYENFSNNLRKAGRLLSFR